MAATSRLDEAPEGADLVMTAVPSHGYRTVIGPASRHGVEMPIAAAVGQILNEGGAVRKDLAELMGRSAKAEGRGVRPLP